MNVLALLATTDHDHEHEDHGAEVITNSGAGEHVHEHSGNLLQDYWDLLTDPSHFLVELTFLIFGEILIALILLPLAKKYFNYRLAKAHAELDAEHGVSHDKETGEVIVNKPASTEDRFPTV